MFRHFTGKKTLLASVFLSVFFLHFFTSVAYAFHYEFRAGFRYAHSKGGGLGTGGNGYAPGDGVGFVLDGALGVDDGWVDLGLRYEQNGISGGTTGTFHRISLLVRREFHFGRFFIGPEGTLGFVNTVDYGPVARATSSLSSSLGADLGVTIDFVRIGATVGYLFANVQLLDPATGNAAGGLGNLGRMVLSGPFVHGFVGVTF